MRLLISLCGDSNKASSRVRGFWIAEALENQGVQCSLRWQSGKLDLLRFAFEMMGHDAILFQKTYSRYHRWLMRLAKLMGKRCYIDIDDAPSKTNVPKTLRNFEAMVAMSNGVFAGGQNLVDYCIQFQPKTYLIPSCINLDLYDVKSHDDNDKICLGWIGNGAYYKDDLIELLVEPLRLLSLNHQIRFKIVGACGVKALYDAFGSIDALEIDFVDAINWSDPSAVSRSIDDFDIGLYPLLPTPFNQHKCGFKALEYMAKGIPVVSSSVAVNAEIITEGGDGMIVNSPEGWVKSLDKLICDTKRRKMMGKNGRKKIEKDFNVNSVAHQILEIIAGDIRG